MLLISKLIRVSVILLLTGSLIFGPRVYAQNDLRGVIISPAKQELELKPGDNSIVNFDLSNDSPDSDLLIKTSLQTFTRGEGGRPLLRPFNQEEVHQNWLTLPVSFPIAKSSKQSVQVAIQIPQNAQPGGYTYAITFNVGQPTQTQVNTDSVRVEKNIAALLLLTVSGETRRSLEVDKLQVTPWLVDPFLDDLKIDWEFKNDSERNFITPKGNLIVYQFEDSPILIDQVNSEASTVLERSSRSYSVIQEGMLDTPLSSKIPKMSEVKVLGGARPWFGLATVKINFSYIDGASTLVTKTASTTVFFFPWKGLALLLILSGLLGTAVWLVKNFKLKTSKQLSRLIPKIRLSPGKK